MNFPGVLPFSNAIMSTNQVSKLSALWQFYSWWHARQRDWADSCGSPRCCGPRGIPWLDPFIFFSDHLGPTQFEAGVRDRRSPSSAQSPWPRSLTCFPVRSNIATAWGNVREIRPGDVNWMTARAAASAALGKDAAALPGAARREGPRHPELGCAAPTVTRKVRAGFHPTTLRSWLPASG